MTLSLSKIKKRSPQWYPSKWTTKNTDEFYHSNIWPYFPKCPGLHTFFTYKFNVKPHEPYKIKPYPVPFSRCPAIQHEIDKMFDWQIIERSDSHYNNPLATAIKANGSIRLCLDARKLNTVILSTRDASPPIDDILAKFNNKNIFSSRFFLRILADPSWPLHTTIH